MESYLDCCEEIVHDHQLGGAVPVAGDSLERKVHALISDHQEGVSEEESIACLGQAILDTRALLTCLETDPTSSDQEIASFLQAWRADTEAPEWAGKNTAERLHQLIALFCATLDGFCGGYIDEIGLNTEPIH